MTRNEFIEQFENLVCEYCRGGDHDYGDVDDSFDYSYQGNYYSIRLNVVSENFSDEEQET